MRYHWPRACLAAGAIAASVATLLVTHTVSERQAERSSRLLGRFEARYLVAFDSYTTTLDAEDVDRHRAALERAGVVRRHDFLLVPFVDETDPIPLLLCGVPDAEPDELRALVTIAEGRRPRADAAEALIERGLAERRRLGVGDFIRPFEGREPLRVVGLFARESDVASADVYAPLAGVQRLWQRPGEISFTLLEVAPGRRPEQVAAAVADVLPELRVLTLGAARARATAAAAPLRLVARTLSVVVSVLGAAVVFLTLWSTVSERAADYAVLRAMGFGPASILLGVMSQAAVLGGAGAVIGALAGTAIVRGVVSQVHPALGLWPDATVVGVAVGATLAVVMAGATIPALRAARAAPLTLMGQTM
jgi:ABC-type lipoprotein release transport system permease subunit